MTEFVDLETAVADHVGRGDAVHVINGHSRWTALVREVARQHWHDDSRLTLIMASLSSLSTLLFRGGCVAKVVTVYSGDSFPTYTPNPIYQQAYQSGEVEVEHWSFVPYAQRLQAAADGLPAAVTGSVRGSSMAANVGYTEVDSPFGSVSLVAPLVPDVTLVHAAVADTAGNVALAPPLLEGVAGAFAARRGVLATVERVVDDLRPYASAVRIPAHRVLAVVEAPLGAHPGGLYVGTPGQAASLPAEPYAEDLEFWTEARDASRRPDFDVWIKEWCLDIATHEAYLAKLGEPRIAALKRRADPLSWKEDDAAYPIDLTTPPTAWENAASWMAAEVVAAIEAVDADAVLAGAGASNLAAWLGVTRSRAAGRPVRLAAEVGMWGYVPTPADPYIFNFRNFPTCEMLADAATVLGTLLGGPGTRSIACVGSAQVDRHGNLNTTLTSSGSFIVGSGGANDAVTRADMTIAMSPMHPRRTVETCSYVTSPGDRVRTVVTDKGVLRKHDGELVLSAVPAGPAPLADRVADARAACGWDLTVAREVAELAPIDHADLTTLRDYDRRGWFLRGDG